MQTVELDFVIVILSVIQIEIPLIGLCCCCCPMGDNSEGSKQKTSNDMEKLSLDTNRFSIDLLQRFKGSGGSKQNEFKAVKREVEEDEDEDLELSLGLSLGGRFGVDKNSMLMRSSSVAACLPIVRDDDALAAPARVYPALARTSSLPVESEEEWRKRKELQTLRRMEAKRRRSEKQRNSKADKEGGGGVGGGGSGGGSGSLEEEKKEIEANWRVRLELLAAKRFASSVSSPFGSNALTAASRQASLGRGIDLAIAKGKASYAGGDGGGLVQPSSQGSIESQGGSSSSLSELENKALQGSSSAGDLSPASIQSLQEGCNYDAGSSGTKTKENASGPSGADKENPPSKRTDVSGNNRGKEIGKNSMEDMPCVFTKGDGPNGRRVDGILYKYGKGEDVRIMCVCHGDFLSPAEFVKHAGGSDIAHPLKHIVINPTPPSFR